MRSREVLVAAFKVTLRNNEVEEVEASEVEANQYWVMLLGPNQKVVFAIPTELVSRIRRMAA